MKSIEVVVDWLLNGTIDLQLSKKAHPDAGGSVDHFHELTEAYSVLGDDAKR